MADKKIRRKVTLIWGKFDETSNDFVLEPYFEGDEKEEEVFWIEKCEDEDEKVENK
jgi:hypothetical protein